jgi:branched-chain amino acid aminotransferase
MKSFMKIYCNGDLIDKQAIAEIFEPGFLFGWGAFEPIRVYGENISFLNEHLERLNQSLDLLGIERVECDFKKAIEGLVVENNVKDAYVRLTAYKRRQGSGLLIYVDKFAYYPQEVYDRGFNAVISPHPRSPDNICSKVKSLSYLQNRLSWLWAQEAKKNESIVLNPYGYVAGGSRSNLFLVKNDCLLTPPLSAGAFDGITRKAVKKIAVSLGLEVKEENIKASDICKADEAFITSALMEVMPLVDFEDEPIKEGKPGKITLQLLSEYRKLLKIK